MARYLVKQFKNGKKRIAFVSGKVVFGCPDRKPGERHSDSRLAGDRFSFEEMRDVEREEDDGLGNYTERVTIVTRYGKMDEKHLPICRCGKEFVRLGYHFTLTDEWHDKRHNIGGFMRDSTDDKVLEDRWFSRRRSANTHLDVVYDRANKMRGG